MTLRMLSVLIVAFALTAVGAAQEVVTFDDSWGAPGIQVTSQSPSGLEITYSVPSIQIHDIQVGNEILKKVSLPGAMLGNNEGAPDLPGIEHAVKFIDFVEGPVVVHCFAGVGRTGTIIAAYLVSTGLSAPQAIARVRMERPFSIETSDQEAVVYEYEMLLKERDA